MSKDVVEDIIHVSMIQLCTTRRRRNLPNDGHLNNRISGKKKIVLAKKENNKDSASAKESEVICFNQIISIKQCTYLL